MTICSTSIVLTEFKFYFARHTYTGARKKGRGDVAVKDEGPEPQDYSRCTVAELKDMCKSKGLKVTGAKADLIARLLEEN